MKYGADSESKDNVGKTPLHYNHCITCLYIIIKEQNTRKEEEKDKMWNILDLQDNKGNTCLMQAILDLKETTAKLNLVKEIVKWNADFSIQNNKGKNALMLAAEHCNSDILGMIIMKMLNDELENKVIVRDKLKSEAIMKLKNNQEEDVLTIAIMARSKEWISILIDIANFTIEKSHVKNAKEYLQNNSKLYGFIKKRYQSQESKYIR